MLYHLKKKKGKVLQKSTVQVSISSAVFSCIFTRRMKKINQYTGNPIKFTKINIQFHINNQWLQIPCQKTWPQVLYPKKKKLKQKSKSKWMEGREVGNRRSMEGESMKLVVAVRCNCLHWQRHCQRAVCLNGGKALPTGHSNHLRPPSAVHCENRLVRQERGA